MKIIFTLLILLIPMVAFAPSEKYFYMERPLAVNPYIKVRNAIGIFETRSDTLAFNPLENAAGIYQIRQIRLDDYYVRTGKKYSLIDCFRPQIANEIYIYYASQYNPWEVEKICREWNGGAYGMKIKATKEYYSKVKIIINGN
jgi:hypothetical protein